VVASYHENLRTCLDGRFWAFCDHALLTAADAVSVARAEREANFTTCIDPAWQHLCRPDLLPDPETEPPASADGRAPDTILQTVGAPRLSSSSANPLPGSAAAP
jgi:hypothetical protein